MVAVWSFPEDFLKLFLGDMKAERLNRGEVVESALIDEFLFQIGNWISWQDRMVVGLNEEKRSFQHLSSQYWSEKLKNCFSRQMSLSSMKG